MAITPEQLASSGLESSHQKALMCWCALNFSIYPELKWLFHIPNGGLRNKATAANLRAMGAKSGVPDLFLPIKRGMWSGLWIELKKPDLAPKRKGPKPKKNKGASEEQEEWISHLHSQGFGAMVCYSWTEARDILIQYLES